MACCCVAASCTRICRPVKTQEAASRCHASNLSGARKVVELDIAILGPCGASRARVRLRHLKVTMPIDGLPVAHRAPRRWGCEDQPDWFGQLRVPTSTACCSCPGYTTLCDGSLRLSRGIEDAIGIADLLRGRSDAANWTAPLLVLSKAGSVGLSGPPQAALIFRVTSAANITWSGWPTTGLTLLSHRGAVDTAFRFNPGADQYARRTSFENVFPAGWRRSVGYRDEPRRRRGHCR